MKFQNCSRKFFSVFNHTLTARQIQDAKKSLKVTDIVEMPKALKRIWGQIPPEFESIEKVITPVKEWIRDSSNKSDVVLVQGDFGATWFIVNFAFENKLIPVYSTTRREASETRQTNGSIKTEHIFMHQCFRQYGC